MSRFPQVLFYLLLTSLSLAAQQVSGTVTDSLTGAPIPFATVYFDGTTIGETTNEEGHFTLPASSLRFPATLIASHLSFGNKSIQLREARSSVHFALRPLTLTVAAVEVTDQNQRLKNLEEFRALFLGVDDWGRRATIKGEDALFFEREYRRKRLSNARSFFPDGKIPSTLKNARWADDGTTLLFEKANNLTAASNASLEIDLPDLGYVLFVDLQRFRTDYTAGTTNRLGTYFWQPYEGNNPEKARKKHLKNRERAYYNSNIHFLRSLFQDRLEAEGYAIYEVIGNDARPFTLNDYLVETETDDKEIVGLKGRVLSILYYADGRGRPLPKRRWKRASPIQSSLHIVGDRAAIRPDGTTGESPLLFGGAMGLRRAAWMLPGDY
ncbi:carboxypeptidase-like regulatory domain-containing protein [Neolewinella agarilytica]|uniref:CarboxypepD_reg-like domain-containing protein n=1 Tax=Neolewinella agarilytica TaxID=478744 RepID=A0A1H9LTH8_9BACT|nr:carboxypeptidase-like regulatory domain-containing protein [Neolewinella agarilytica]SER14507.1 CarboxypepD_reg-like domain-containing protein [Neolewinella agarilytica]